LSPWIFLLLNKIWQIAWTSTRHPSRLHKRDVLNLYFTLPVNNRESEERISQSSLNLLVNDFPQRCNDPSDLETVCAILNAKLSPTWTRIRSFKAQKICDNQVHYMLTSPIVLRTHIESEIMFRFSSTRSNRPFLPHRRMLQAEMTIVYFRAQSTHQVPNRWEHQCKEITLIVQPLKRQ
jgi:hypothetical protein